VRWAVLTIYRGRTVRQCFLYLGDQDQDCQGVSPTPSRVSSISLILHSLDAFGVEYIELTSPAASPESRAHCEAICKLGLKRTKILTHIRCHMDDARIAVETGMSPSVLLWGHG
jgi:hypothetical protein